MRSKCKIKRHASLRQTLDQFMKKDYRSPSRFESHKMPNVYKNASVESEYGDNGRWQSKSTLASTKTFPFKNTASGNLKLDPSQVVYESNNISVVAADPKSITLNMSESCNTLKVESKVNTTKDTWATTCLYTAKQTEGNTPFHSEFSDSVSESDGGDLFPSTKPYDKTSELSLAKMGYVIDDKIDWKNLVLPKKTRSG